MSSLFTSKIRLLELETDSLIVEITVSTQMAVYSVDYRLVRRCYDTVLITKVLACCTNALTSQWELLKRLQSLEFLTEMYWKECFEASLVIYNY